MKNVNSKWLLVATVLFITWASVPGYAQDNEEEPIIYIQTFQMEWPEGGTATEFDSLEALNAKHVVAHREHQLRKRTMWHYIGTGGGLKYVVIREYASRDDMFKDWDQDVTPLFEAHWDTEEKREAWGKAWGKYWRGSTHDDEIYHESVGGRK